MPVGGQPKAVPLPVLQLLQFPERLLNRLLRNIDRRHLLKLGQGEGTGRAHHGMLHEFAEAALKYGLRAGIIQPFAN